MIVVVGLGPGDVGDLTRRAEQVLRQARRLFLRTRVHPTVAALEAWGLIFETFDDWYRQELTFEEVYHAIVTRLLAVGSQEDIVYAVPGNPLVGETTVSLLLAQQGVPITIIPGLSGLEMSYACLGVDPAGGLQVVDAMQLDHQEILPDRPTLVLQLWSSRVASEAKLSLMRYFPDEHLVTVVRGAGVSGQERRAVVPLFTLDRVSWIDHLTSLYLPPAALRGVRRLESLMHRLRAPGGCPWDAEQTHQSLRRYCLEEAYEVVEAIDQEDDDALEEELGDLLLQVVFHCELAAETGKWSLSEVADRVCDKLVARHPHVFSTHAGGEAPVLATTEVLRRWDDLKRQEKPATSAVAGVPLALPALVASEKLQTKAAAAGFAWPDWQGALRKLQEEMQELCQALETPGEGESRAALIHEIGDVLTALVNLARFFAIDPEQALRDANTRFIRRFETMELLAGGSMKDKSLAELLALWSRAKKPVG
ncbi:MAG: nucleoside triphosphate pyrophosphohydrolase [Cyanobacteria bacterium NC_groundwater_1444_Ag_S-0.65um_54_12]|nr:nucleoside triphosphate pyrophosphohydrolase [Cyanobacteria bacterium NC_groundwater_1444_Ag_S-0.65um_54_12]